MRRKVSDQELRDIGRIRIYNDTDYKAAYSKVVFTKLGPFACPKLIAEMDSMYTISRTLATAGYVPDVPSWSGLMQLMFTSTETPGPSSLYLLPFINLKPSSESCVRSTLEYGATLAAKYQCDLVLYFDQQLWWVAYMLIEKLPSTHPLKLTILLLGGFHGQASLQGTIGDGLMGGSGLKEATLQ